LELINHLKVVLRDVLLDRPVFSKVTVRKRKDLGDSFSVMVTITRHCRETGKVNNVFIEAVMADMEEEEQYTGRTGTTSTTTPFDMLGPRCRNLLLDNIARYIRNGDDAGALIERDQISACRRISKHHTVVICVIRSEDVLV
jgi:hypothetical protein